MKNVPIQSLFFFLEKIQCVQFYYYSKKCYRKTNTINIIVKLIHPSLYFESKKIDCKIKLNVLPI